MTTRILALALLLTGTAAPATAQNREHVQMAAELRILQEQTQQLAVTLARLGQALTALDARVEAGFGEIQDASRQSFADQRLIIGELQNDLRVVRERTQENNARVGTLREELEALRQAMLARPAPVPVSPPFDPFSPGPGPDPFGPPPQAPAQPPVEAPPAASAPQAAPPVVTSSSSPDRMFRAAWADYTSGQYTLAIIGFEQFVRTFPSSERADEAQLLIGDSYYQMNRFQDAINAYNQVIQHYPAGQQIAAAYYKRGLAESQLGRAGDARASWETVLDRYPNSDVAGLARQGLQRLGDQSSR
jgi:tol-pal system protein YbgF